MLGVSKHYTLRRLVFFSGCFFFFLPASMRTDGPSPAQSPRHPHADIVDNLGTITRKRAQNIQFCILIAPHRNDCFLALVVLGVERTLNRDPGLGIASF
ncbi:hypothetical protein P280DRAFT_246167 [Massarina eburnea CBS 473.64]|uniref:Uncharacterized protein n=1 Tax=Massarina eburnea CBS 473.64 TaxID=1395130 RepID=A0A6A6S8Y5_9PLEO|nr:hypothetical protein P280DRAFT_246167 [Massarina eburnea CBS 473.64]